MIFFKGFKAKGTKEILSRGGDKPSTAPGRRCPVVRVTILVSLPSLSIFADLCDVRVWLPYWTRENIQNGSSSSRCVSFSIQYLAVRYYGWSRHRLLPVTISHHVSKLTGMAFEKCKSKVFLPMNSLSFQEISSVEKEDNWARKIISNFHWIVPSRSFQLAL